jgi:hypothetical protein
VSEEKDQSFSVVDKRHGRSEGGSSEPETPSDSEPPTTTGHGPMPAMDFSTFLISLSTSALFHMGLVAEEEGAAAPPADLPMAKQTIDILELLQEKTRGNLSDEEAHLFESLLYELRMRFVEAQGRG